MVEAYLRLMLILQTCFDYGFMLVDIQAQVILFLNTSKLSYAINWATPSPVNSSRSESLQSFRPPTYSDIYIDSYVSLRVYIE